MTLEVMAHQPPRFRLEHKFKKQMIGGVGLLAGIGAGVAGYAYFREPLNVRLDHLTIHIPGARGHLPVDGLRILHLSDTHFRGADWREQPKIESILRACLGLNYDLLIHTGDFLHYDSGLPNVLTLLDKLPRPRLGAYAVFGNHDYVIYSHDHMFERGWTNFCEREECSEACASLYKSRLKVQETVPTVWDRLARLVRFGYYFMQRPLDLKRLGRNDFGKLEAALAARNIQTLHNRFIHLRHNPGRPDGVDLYIAGVDDLVEGAPDMCRALPRHPQSRANDFAQPQP